MVFYPENKVSASLCGKEREIKKNIRYNRSKAPVDRTTNQNALHVSDLANDN